MILTEICAYLRNYFPPLSKRENRSYIHTRTFTIDNGKISDIDFLKERQYFRIVGSDLNDGVYCNTSDDLKTLQNETFDGCIWEMSVPPDFLKLCEDIQVWRTKNESPDSANLSPFIAESFGGYSYSKSSSRVGESNGGNTITWQGQFSSRLSIWRKI
ncbi:MAG: hypothetical protein K2K02_07205 [Ruminococcus sp.]|nr:hypothetical protein [Ruminococcus sp.]